MQRANVACRSKTLEDKSQFKKSNVAVIIARDVEINLKLHDSFITKGNMAPSTIVLHN